MPPKVKITKDEILKAALGIVRKGGAQALNARALADALGCSTQPVFSNYPGMDELRADVAVSYTHLSPGASHGIKIEMYLFDNAEP